jgi:hypothetical protein
MTEAMQSWRTLLRPGGYLLTALTTPTNRHGPEHGSCGTVRCHFLLPCNGLGLLLLLGLPDRVAGLPLRLPLLRGELPLPVRTPALCHVTPLSITENSVSTTVRTSRAAEREGLNVGRLGY